MERNEYSMSMTQILFIAYNSISKTIMKYTKMQKQKTKKQIKNKIT